MHKGFKKNVRILPIKKKCFQWNVKVENISVENVLQNFFNFAFFSTGTLWKQKPAAESFRRKKLLECPGTAT